MNYKIFLETDVTDSLTYNMRSAANMLFDCAEIVYTRLTWTDWEGSSKDEYLYQLYLCVSGIKNLADQLDFLGFQLAQEVEKWLVTSSKFAG